MALFPLANCLSDKARVAFLEAYGNLDGDVKELDARIAEVEENWGRKPTEDGLAPDVPVKEDVGRIMKQRPHYRGKPG